MKPESNEPKTSFLECDKHGDGVVIVYDNVAIRGCPLCKVAGVFSDIEDRFPSMYSILDKAFDFKNILGE